MWFVRESESVKRQKRIASTSPPLSRITPIGKREKSRLSKQKKRGKRYVVGGVLRSHKCQFYSIRNSQTCSQTFNIPSFSKKKICDLFGSEDFKKPEVRKIVFLAPPPLFPFQNEGGGYADSYLCDRSTYEQKKSKRTVLYAAKRSKWLRREVKIILQLSSLLPPGHGRKEPSL